MHTGNSELSPDPPTIPACTNNALEAAGVRLHFAFEEEIKRLPYRECILIPSKVIEACVALVILPRTPCTTSAHKATGRAGNLTQYAVFSASRQTLDGDGKQLFQTANACSGWRSSYGGGFGRDILRSIVPGLDMSSL
ncbi:hypothetical protein Trydic_g5645 [Trypoxylus dichotomus]